MFTKWGENTRRGKNPSPSKRLRSYLRFLRRFPQCLHLGFPSHSQSDGKKIKDDFTSLFHLNFHSGQDEPLTFWKIISSTDSSPLDRVIPFLVSLEDKWKAVRSFLEYVLKRSLPESLCDLWEEIKHWDTNVSSSLKPNSSLDEFIIEAFQKKRGVCRHRTLCLIWIFLRLDVESYYGSYRCFSVETGKQVSGHAMTFVPLGDDFLLICCGPEVLTEEDQHVDDQHDDHYPVFQNNYPAISKVGTSDGTHSKRRRRRRRRTRPLPRRKRFPRRRPSTKRRCNSRKQKIRRGRGLVRRRS